jgi:NAD(P)-dependent dehydrogenase (short-subunit alcohol dehydrogenase family)
MRKNYNGKLVLVTGAASGIGREIAREFARLKARLALCDLNGDGIQNLASEIAGSGGEAKPFQFDLRNLEGISGLVSTIRQDFGTGIDILVNCAGIGILGMVDDVPLEGYRNNLDVNFAAPLMLIKAVLPEMKSTGEGQIINITSGVAERGMPGVSPYCISKAALNSLSESLRVELAGSGIDVVLVSPGLTDTAFFTHNKVFGNFTDAFNSGPRSRVSDTARKIVESAARSRRKTVLSPRTRFGMWLNFFAPGVMDRLLARMLNKSTGDTDNNS